MHNPIYPDAKNSNEFERGLEFQDFASIELAKKHIILQNISSRRFQYDVGENLQGHEIKLDARCTETGRLSIEIEEKSKSSNKDWIKSGIYRDDNSWLYIQGNYEIIFIFDKKVLRRYFEHFNPAVTEKYGTVRTFYVSMDWAIRNAALVIDLRNLKAA